MTILREVADDDLKMAMKTASEEISRVRFAQPVPTGC